jgi:pseudouridine kinase
VHPVNATGAGDAFTAASVYGELHGWTMERTARFAVKASALTLMSRDTVSERMSAAAVEAVGGAALHGDKGERFS